MNLLIVGGIIFLCAIFPKLRCLLLNPVKVIMNLPKDIYFYFKRKKYNNCVVGVIVAIIGLFGKGKTLTAVHIIANMYKRKNDKMVWCPRRKQMVKQRVKIISNVDLLVPFERFVSLEQVVYAAEKNQAYDDLNDVLTVTLVLGDEFSTQMNSRNFKSNINTNLLNTILTCRHYYIAFYYTTQRYGLVDALLRQVTSYCISCDKSWRLQGLDYFDAWEMENAVSVLQLKPYRRTAWFVTDSDYAMYDTLANVANLKRASENGDMMTDEEILALQCNNGSIENVLHPSRKFKRLRKKIG